MYICSARNIYIYLCPQIYGIAHTPCYQFVLHNFVTTKRKLGKYLIFIRPLGRVGGNLGGQARGRSLSAPLAAPTRYRGGSGGVKLWGKHPAAQPPDRTCQCTVHMVEGRSYRARGISKHISTICNARDRDPRAPNTLAFCVIFFAPLAAPASYTLPRGLGKHRAGVGGFKEN